LFVLTSNNTVYISTHAKPILLFNNINELSTVLIKPAHEHITMKFFAAIIALATSVSAFAPASLQATSSALAAKAFSDALGAQAPVSGLFGFGLPVNLSILWFST